MSGHGGRGDLCGSSVSISLSSGFSCQALIANSASSWRSCFHLVIKRLFISGRRYSQPRPRLRFHLVIERLLISGAYTHADNHRADCVSISLSSGFSFQETIPVTDLFLHPSFHLVIERLLISGRLARHSPRPLPPFQSRYRAASHFRRHSVHVFRHRHSVSISLSSGFSFQENTGQITCNFNLTFQSRYRAASHFRRSRGRGE